MAKKTSIKKGEPVIYKGVKSTFLRWGNPGKTIHIDWNDEMIEVNVSKITRDPDYNYTTAYVNNPNAYKIKN